MSDTQYKDSGFPPLGPDTPRSNAIAEAYRTDNETTYGYLDPEELCKFAGVLEREITLLHTCIEVVSKVCLDATENFILILAEKRKEISELKLEINELKRALTTP